MWIWREDREHAPGGGFDRDDRTRGGWHLDPNGAWTWSENAVGGIDDRVAVGSATPSGRSALALLPSPAAPGDSWVGGGPWAGPASGPGAGPAADSWVEETPIFHAVSDDHSRRARMRPIDGEASWAAIPEPNPGSGPLPVQDGSDRRRSGHLSAVPTVPPPPGSRDDVITGSASPEDEMRRRAERRRRPQRSESARGSGRHAMRDERARESRTGRHSLDV